MLAQAGGAEPPGGEGWLHEIKWDGVRAILARSGSGVRLRSRTGSEMAPTYPEVAAASEAIAPGLVLDGEIVTLDEAGNPSFELLQRRMNLQSPGLVAEATAAVPITYVVFDLLHHRGALLAEPLQDRLAQLDTIELPPPLVRSDAYTDPEPLWSFVRRRSLEGLVSKRRSSPYRPGARSPDWIKTVVFRSVRAVVGGFTPGEGGRLGSFGALILGLPAGDRLRWIGAVGSGFAAADLVRIRAALDEMVTAESPFLPHPELPRATTWVVPSLVAIVQYKQWTSAGRLRGPSFKGFTDYPIEALSWESEGPDSPGG